MEVPLLMDTDSSIPYDDMSECILVSDQHGSSVHHERPPPMFMTQSLLFGSSRVVDPRQYAPVGYYDEMDAFDMDSGIRPASGEGDAAAVPAPGARPSTAMDQSVLAAPELRYVSEASTYPFQGIHWFRFIVSFVFCALASPLYFVFLIRSQVRPEPMDRTVGKEENDSVSIRRVFAIGIILTAYWVALWALLITYWSSTPAVLESSEILLTIMLHLMCAVVVTLLPSIQWNDSGPADESARALGNMPVRATFHGTPYSVKPAAKPAPKTWSALQVATMLLQHDSRVRGLMHDRATYTVNQVPWIHTFLAVIAAAAFAVAPDIYRARTGVYKLPNLPDSFYAIVVLATIVNFFIAIAIFDILGKVLINIYRNRNLALAFQQVNSASYAKSNATYHMDLKVGQNFWAWFAIRSFLIHRVNLNRQRSHEVVLAASLLFLGPLGIFVFVQTIFFQQVLTVFTATSGVLVTILALYFVACVGGGAAVHDIFRAPDPLLKEQLQIHAILCQPETSQEERMRLKELNAALTKTVSVLNHTSDNSVIMRVFGVQIDARFANIMLGSLLSALSTSASVLLRPK